MNICLINGRILPAVLASCGIDVAGSEAYVYACSDKVKKALASISVLTSDGKILAKAGGSTPALIREALDKLATVALRFVSVGATVTDPKTGAVTQRKRVGGKPTDAEVLAGKKIVANVMSDLGVTEEQFKASAEALIFAAKLRGKTLRLVDLVDKKTGRTVQSVRVPVKQYGHPDEPAGQISPAAGLDSLCRRFAAYGLIARDPVAVSKEEAAAEAA